MLYSDKDYLATNSSSPSSTSSQSPTTSAQSSSVTTSPTGNSSMCVTDGVNAIYSGYSTNPSLQCECVTEFQNWYSTSAPPTRTIERSIGAGSVLSTITDHGTTITTEVASLLVYTETFTGNVPGADGFDWYGTAKAPCVSLLSTMAVPNMDAHSFYSAARARLPLQRLIYTISLLVRKYPQLLHISVDFQSCRGISSNVFCV